MERAGFTLYTRGKTHGITDREGNKYRLNRLGLADEWERLGERMKSYFHAEKTKQEKQSEERADHTATKATTEQDPIQTEAEKRLAEMKAIRAKRAAKQQQQASTKRQDRER
jgi:hypothetical protein